MARALNDGTLTVFHDGSCPLCRREISFYRNCAGGSEINWHDVSAAGDTHVAPGLTREAAMRRFHVRLENGNLAEGGDAFIALWETLPGFRLPARFLGLPGMRYLVNKAYDGFLLIRPMLQRVSSRQASA